MKGGCNLVTAEETTTTMMTTTKKNGMADADETETVVMGNGSWRRHNRPAAGHTEERRVAASLSR